jgi:hypothetical protein
MEWQIAERRLFFVPFEDFLLTTTKMAGEVGSKLASTNKVCFVAPDVGTLCSVTGHGDECNSRNTTLLTHRGSEPQAREIRARLGN